ncbi:hypothetical protein FPQ18DRAFT_290217 [Pyronema domesticum]|uniref:Uncharacterized protein n=1 Tax=Pyronema omphalodes (strain CBS 100304) TaxID=1076935 RepID=U4KYK1_PYROM|nr:hypothetical protein FPQ18DRAFT_290217 [Pyronema domesticum]CCX06650.1 Similar to hypothetical protein [Tuber melanosporum Mel28]; acc. no. XP_002835497 [Pyronema omphalodes CBS 100304]
MSNVDIPNAILRGAQLTIVGALRALQNPRLFNETLYKQAAIAVAASLAIRLVIAIPTVLVRILLWFFGFIIDFQSSGFDVRTVSGLAFIEKSVLQLPFFLMACMRFVSPAMDEMFMKSLQWVDQTYVVKHKADDPSTLRAMYYPNLQMYNSDSVPSNEPHEKKSSYVAIMAFCQKYARRAGISMAIYLLTFMPWIGPFVLPAASFYSLNKAVGPLPAMVFFMLGFVLPKRWMVFFLQGFFASRSLMRELLEPYFSRIHFTKDQKNRWFRDREAVLFGFGLGFYMLLKTPWVGVLVYGIAEASTAYLITKITDPPPAPSESAGFAETQIAWKNKHEFLKLRLDDIDKLNEQAANREDRHFHKE